MRAHFCVGWLALSLTIIPQSGCQVLSARWHAFFQYKAERSVLAQKAAIDELHAVERSLQDEDAAHLEQRQLDLLRVRAKREKERCEARSQFDESIRTKLGVDFDQRMEIGQLQVDLEQMKGLLDQREQQYAQQVQAYNRQAQGGPCCRCDTPQRIPCDDCTTCAPGCCYRCGQPFRPQETCAGTRPFADAPKRPQRQPISAMEIPLMLPVRLQLGATNSYLNDSQIRRLPYEDGPCPERCGRCTACQSGDPCSCLPLSEAPSMPLAPAVEVVPVEIVPE